MRADVVGAGIGGLALAVFLRSDGWQVRTRERAPELPSSGTTLGLWPSAMAVLDRLGVGDRVRRAGLIQRDGRICRPNGKIVATVSVGRGAWLVNRADLIQALASAAGPVEFGNAIMHLPGAFPGADLIVGADGVNSVVRGAITHRPPVAPGMTIWRGRAALDVGEASETWGPGYLFGFTPRPTTPGATPEANWFAMTNEPPDRASITVPDVFAGWHPAVRRVIDAIDPASTIRHEALLAPRTTYVRVAGGLLRRTHRRCRARHDAEPGPWCQ